MATELKPKDLLVGLTYRTKCGREVYVYGLLATCGVTHTIRYKVMTGPLAERFCECSVPEFLDLVESIAG